MFVVDEGEMTVIVDPPVPPAIVSLTWLKIRTQIKCPVCGQERLASKKVKIYPRYRTYSNKDLVKLRKLLLEFFSKAFLCTGCGTRSEIAERDAKPIRTLIVERLTWEWFKEQADQTGLPWGS